MPFKRCLLCLFLPLLLASCSSSFLSVQTDYLSHENLASYHVNTPDPILNHPPIGQRLILMWNIPKHFFQPENTYMKIWIRFRNREQIEKTLYLTKNSGTYVFSLLNEDFLEKRGILTYKVDLMEGNNLLEEWRHQIWEDLITVGQQENPPESTAESDLEWNEDEF